MPSEWLARRGDSFSQQISTEHPPYAKPVLGSGNQQRVGQAEFCPLSGGGDEQETHEYIMYCQVSTVFIATSKNKARLVDRDEGKQLGVGRACFWKGRTLGCPVATGLNEQ